MNKPVIKYDEKADSLEVMFKDCLFWVEALDRNVSLFHFENPMFPTRKKDPVGFMIKNVRGLMSHIRFKVDKSNTFNIVDLMNAIERYSPSFPAKYAFNLYRDIPEETRNDMVEGIIL